MPCYDPRGRDCDGSCQHVERRSGLNIDELEAILCGVLSVFVPEDRIWSRLDYKEIGVSQERIMKWYVKHQEADARRRVREAAAAKERAIRAEALRKLTRAERRALGLREP